MVTGTRFGRRIVKKVTTGECGRTHWVMLCDCGGEATVRPHKITNGRSHECAKCAARRRRVYPGGAKAHPLYQTWRNMKTRCYNPNHNQYGDYGGRGISVCDEWLHSFSAFVNDMGARPFEGATLERLDGNKGYMPSNCVWASRSIQSKNRRPYTHRKIRRVRAELGVK